MATSAYSVGPSAITGELRRQSRLRLPGKPDGGMVFEAQKSFVGTDFDVAGDMIQICKFPDRFRLFGLSLKSDNELDTGGTALRVDLVLDDSAGTAFTTAAGAAFTNQPANDGVEVVSDAAGDTTQTITIIGTTTATDTVVVETITLNGTSQVATTKTDWGFILAAFVASGTLTAASTVTLREASGNAAITTLTPAVTTRGVNTVTSTSYYNRKVSFAASGSSTKTIGFKGTDEDGNVIYDAQAATGATQEQSNLSFVTVTEIYTGDLESNRTITASPGEQVLVAASAAFNQTPILPINFNGASISGSEYGMDVSNQILALRVGVAPTTGAGASVLTATVHGYISANPLVTLV
jgi:hypothetical protein